MYADVNVFMLFIALVKWINLKLETYTQTDRHTLNTPFEIMIIFKAFQTLAEIKLVQALGQLMKQYYKEEHWHCTVHIINECTHVLFKVICYVQGMYL